MRWVAALSSSPAVTTARAVLGNRFSVGVLWNVGSLGILALGGIFTNVLIVSTRGEDAFGVFSQVYALFLIAGQLGVGGLQFSVLQRVSYHQDDPAKCSAITSSALLLATVSASAIMAFMALAAPAISRLLTSPELEEGLLIAVPGLIFFSANKILNNTLNGLRHMRTYAVMQSLRFVLIPVVVAVVTVARLRTPYLALSLTVTEIILFVVLVLYVYGRVFAWSTGTQLRQEFIPHIRFALRGMLSGVIIQLDGRVSILLLGYFSTDARVGIFSFASTLVDGFLQIPLAVRWNIDPIFGRHFAANQLDEIAQVARKVRRVFFPLMGLLALAAAGVYPLLFRLFIGTDTVMTSWGVFVILMAGVVFGSLYRPFQGILLQGGRPGIYTGLALAMIVVNVLLNVLLIPLANIYGAALAGALTYVIWSLAVRVSAWRVFRIAL